jgi:anhydro-N-acetylmuramic acid kinase
MHSTYTIIGIMSGTSLDGVDIALSTYHYSENKWSFNFTCGKTYKYPVVICEKLKIATQLSAVELLLLDKTIGNLFAEFVEQFICDFQLDKQSIDAIGSHGHTIFHQPESGFTQQIGCGTTISVKTGIPVINDFRTKDVVLGGQGAPLVPIGDFLLFQTLADGFLNIGGISNISFKSKNKIYAYDICPGNIPLNLLMNTIGKEFDEDGKEAAKGQINPDLLNAFNNLAFYSKTGAKSLGIEWLKTHFIPLLLNEKDTLPNKLYTCCEHIAYQIAQQANTNQINRLLITGGGAFNTHLINRISNYYKGEIILPTKDIIEFKEAIVFGFLSVLYLEKQVNCLKDVTGAYRDSCGGVLHIPN